VELAKQGYNIVIDDELEVVKQIKLIYDDLFEYK